MPTPSGQTARTTSYAYDSMNRVVTITAPLSRITVYGYDSGGNLVKVTDPMSRVTSIAYDAAQPAHGGDGPADGSQTP